MGIVIMALPKIKSTLYSTTLSGKKVVYRTMTHKEQTSIFEAKELSKKDMLLNLIAICDSCVEEPKNYSTGDSNLVDFILLLTAIRKTSKDNVIPAEVVCDECDKKNNIKIFLDNVKSEHKESKLKDGILQVDDEVSLKIKDLSVNDFINLESCKNEVDMFRNIVEFVMHGEEVFDLADETDDEVITFLMSIPSERMQELDEHVKNLPTAYIETKFTCTHCKAENVKKLTRLEAL